jgi:hypothetical protein
MDPASHQIFFSPKAFFSLTASRQNEGMMPIQERNKTNQRQDGKKDRKV